MKEKLKKIDLKHLFIVLFITLLIGAFVLVICLLNKYDENRSKTILNKNDDLITLNQNDASFTSSSSYTFRNVSFDINQASRITGISYDLIDNASINIVRMPKNSSFIYFINEFSLYYSNFGVPFDFDIPYFLTSSNTFYNQANDILTNLFYIDDGLRTFSYHLDVEDYSVYYSVENNLSLDNDYIYLGYLSLGWYNSDDDDIYLNVGTDYFIAYFSNYSYNSLENEISNLQNNPTITENQNILSNYKNAIFYYNNSNIYNTTNLRLTYDVNFGFTFLDLFDGEDFEHLDYIELLYDSITIENSLLYVLTNGVGRACHIVFYNDNTSILDFNYPYIPNDTNTSDDMPFPIEISGSCTFNKVRVYNLRPFGDYGINFNSLYLNSSNASYNYLLGFQDGYNRGIEDGSSTTNDFINLQSDYNSLSANYQTLLEQYNVLLNQSDYSFSELFWSISAVPFGVLTSAFNVNVLGVNLRGIITGLFTALLLIWLIRRLF